MVSIDTLYYFYLHPVRSGKQLNEKKNRCFRKHIHICEQKILRLVSVFSECDLLGGLKPPFPSEVLSQ